MGAAFGGKIFHAGSQKDTRKWREEWLERGCSRRLVSQEEAASPRRLRGYAHSHDDQQDSADAARVKAETITTQDDASP